MQSRTPQSDQSNFSLASAHKSSMSFKYKEFFDAHEPLITSGEDLLDWLANEHPHATYQDYLDLRNQTAEQGYKTAFDLPLTENEFKYRRILKQFSQWNTGHQSTCADADSLLDWLFFHHRGEALVYDEFLSLMQAGASQGLVTAMDVPVSEAEYNKKYLNNDGSRHILRVPSGMVAKIWVGETPHLLESREEPYAFPESLFRLDRRDADNLFYSAEDELIIHGPIKRLMLRAGQVAVTYDKGNLIIIKPSENGLPTIINSATHEVRGFLNTNVQMMIFPSEYEKKRRQQSGQNISVDELNHYVFMTKDCLKIGVKLLVAYHINDPYKALSQLDENNIVNTIENLVSVNLSKMMMHASAQEFMCDAPPGFYHMLREVLTRELRNYGIELIRLNIEKPFVLDNEIANKMSEYATLNAEANARRAIIDSQAQVQEAETKRDAVTKQIEQEQLNNAVVSKAQAELKAVQLRAEALVLQVKAEAEAKLIQAEAKAKAEAITINTAGRDYKNDPRLLELEKIKIIADSMSKMSLLTPFSMQSPEHVMNPGYYDSFNRFFSRQPKFQANVNQAYDLNVKPGNEGQKYQM